MLARKNCADPATARMIPAREPAGSGERGGGAAALPDSYLRSYGIQLKADPRRPIMPEGYLQYYGIQPVQARGAMAGEEPGRVQELARQGMTGSPQPLPHLDTILRSFGHHDVRAVPAYVGGPAAEASQGMGALAYAAGGAVAFSAQPDLHTAAHEAAHVVQQRAGVSLKGGVGQAGDAYEQHADAVADLVVNGQSAAALLDPIAWHSVGGQTGSIQRQEVQLQEIPQGDRQYTVQRGDTLGRIAQRELGDRRRWVEIVLLNREQNLHRMRPGQALTLPPRERPPVEAPPRHGAPSAVDPERPAQEGGSEQAEGAQQESEVQPDQMRITADQIAQVIVAVVRGQAVPAPQRNAAAQALLDLGDSAFESIVNALNRHGLLRTLFRGVGPGNAQQIAEQSEATFTVNVTIMHGATNTVAEDFDNANRIYRRHGMQLRQGQRVVLNAAQTQAILGADEALDTASDTTGHNITTETLALVIQNHPLGTLGGYWIRRYQNASGGLRGTSFLESVDNRVRNREAVVVFTDTRAGDTFAHELGHILTGEAHLGTNNVVDRRTVARDPGNLMATGGGYRDAPPAHTHPNAHQDHLTPAQVRQMKTSIYAHLTRRPQLGDFEVTEEIRHMA